MNSKPNFLVFMTDHQRGDMQPPFQKAYTPNLDKLYQQGVSFTNAHCPSPHCCPSRATFFSGLYPSEHGIWNNVNVSNTLSRRLFDGVRLFSEDFKDAGYNLYYSGKWHVSAEEGPQHRGFELLHHEMTYRTYENVPCTEEWQTYRQKPPCDMTKERQEGQILRPGYPLYTQYGIEENPFGDADVVDAAIKKIHTLDADNPFFLYVGTLGPHDPYDVPQRFLDLYKPENIQLPASFSDDMSDKPALYRRTRDRYAQLTEAEHRESMRRYLAFCSYEDHLFGQLIEALQENDLLDNTVVLYLSDHGDYMGAHRLWAKGLPCFKEAYHICATMGYGGLTPKGQVCDRLVSLADFAPTLLQLAGLSVDRSFTGTTLLPLLDSQTPTNWRNALFTQSNGNEVYGIQRAVFDDKYKYVFNGFDYDELYDLIKDPHEMHNIIGEAGSDEIVERYCKLLWQFAYDHQDSIVNDYIMTALVPYGPGIIFE